MSSRLPQTLGELQSSKEFYEARLKKRSVKDELRENLIARLKTKQPIFPGIVGFEDTVVPQIVNAVLSKQNFILLGLRGQAKSRILRGLTELLDEQMPYVAGCEIRDNPYHPLCRRCRDLIAEKGAATPIAFLPRQDRYVEKLATPDVTVADLVGDLDPIKAARGGQDLSNELTMHYGLLPRANRGIFAINELPDLAGKIQVALFNIMQEGDVQIKGYPVRLELDVVLAFSANPEDYTARGKIVTPLKDRIGSEIRTHYPETIEEGMAITAQEAWSERGATKITIPQYLREVIEQVAFSAREDKKVDKRSGVSQRLPISTMELVVSNAERRALLHGEKLVVPRVSDLYAAMPGITGKARTGIRRRDARRRRGGAGPDSRRDRQDLRQVFLRHQYPADRAMVQPGGHGAHRRRSAVAGHPRGTEADSGPVRAAVAGVGQGLRRARDRGRGGGIPARRHVRAQAAEPQ